MAIQARKPLILLPQTYGPFGSASSRQTASRILRRATMAWARDPDSYECLLTMGSGHDGQRYVQGVDMAFLLPGRDPGARLDRSIQHWLSSDRDRPTIGVNISGYNYGGDGLGLRTQYTVAVRALLRTFLDDSEARIVLVPHVRKPAQDSDDLACHDVLGSLPPEDRARVIVLPPGLNAHETKWVVSRLDWFCGTRMHSTIAALSSGVPTSAIAYSPKTAGVFASCGLRDQVADARSLDTSAITPLLWSSWEKRASVAAKLRERLPLILARAEEQADSIVATCGAASE